MKILLVNPPHRDFKFLPLGLASISAVLHDSGVEVKILDLSVEQMKLIQIGEIAKSYDMIGITSTSRTFSEAKKVAQAIKKQSDSPIVLGGHHATLFKGNVLENSNFDIAVIGEGEETIVDLLSAIQGKRQIALVKGIAWKDRYNVIHTNEPRSLIDNLDSMPLPLRRIFPIVKYEIAGNLQTSRGCPYSCIYCLTPHVYPGKLWRARSPNKVIDEIVDIIEVCGTHKIFIVDDNFLVDNKRVSKICDLIMQNRLELEIITWNGVRADLVQEDILAKMYKAGLKKIIFGIESVNDDVLRNINKGMTRSQINNAIKLAKKYQIEVSAFFMVGNPGDTLETIQESLDFTAEQDIGSFFGNVVPYPGTPLFDWVERNGVWLRKINNEFIPSHVEKEILFETKDFSLKQRRQAWRRVHRFHCDRRLINLWKTGQWLNPRKSAYAIKEWVKSII